MKREFRELRQAQLARSLPSFAAAKNESRPQHGWLRAIREGLGLSRGDVGKKMGKTRQRIEEFEKAEANDVISLRSLRRVAAAMDCELVYGIVPRSGTIHDVIKLRVRDQVTEDVLAVENTMALEGQASGGVQELIEDETKRRLNKS